MDPVEILEIPGMEEVNDHVECNCNNELKIKEEL